MGNISEDIKRCQKCSLYAQTTCGPTPGAWFTQNDSPDIFLVQNSPSKLDHERGQVFSSPDVGNFLKTVLVQAGIDPKRLYRTSMVKCWNDVLKFEGNTAQELKTCGDWLDLEIKVFKPKLIIAYGSEAIYRFSDEYDKKELPRKKLAGISQAHGELFWSKKYDTWIMYSLSPGYVVKQSSKMAVFQDAYVKLGHFIQNGFSFGDRSTNYNWYTQYTPNWIENSKKFLTWVKTQPDWSFDLETTGFDPQTEDIILASFSWARGEAMAIQWSPELVPYFKDALESEHGVHITMQNGKFDLKFLYQEGIYPTRKQFDFDTQIAGHMVDENSPVGLNALSIRYLGEQSYKDDFWSQFNSEDLFRSKEAMDRFCAYACKDADFTLQLKHRLKPILECPFNYEQYPELKEQVKRTPIYAFENIAMPLTHVLAKIESHGLRFDQGEYGKLLANELETQSKQIYKECSDYLYETIFSDPEKIRTDFLNSVLELRTIVRDVLTSSLNHYEGKSEFKIKLTEEYEEIDRTFNEIIKVFEDSNGDIKKQTKYVSELLYKIHEVEVDGKVKRTYSGVRKLVSSFKTRVNKINKKFDPQLTKVIENIEILIENLTKVFAFEFNPSSAKQCGEYIYNVLKLPVLERTEKGEPSTKKEVLNRLAEQTNDPFVNKIVAYREVEHDISNYIVGIKKEVSVVDGRVHASFSQTSAVTGRLACKEPALHGIKRSFQIRNSAIPDPEHLLFEGDYSQAEIRFLAVMSNDTRLIDAFKAGGDIHEENARRIFNVPDGVKPTKEQRSATKRIVFAILYGSAVASVAESLNITVAEAEKYFSMFYEVYPRTKEWMAYMHDFVKTYGFVVNHYGRIRRLPNIFHGNRGQYNEALRQSVNAPIQGSATGDYTALAHIKLQEEIETNWAGCGIHQVHNHHDALLIQVPFKYAKQVVEPFTKIAEEFADPTLGCPMVFDSGISNCWAGNVMTDDDIDYHIWSYYNDKLPIAGRCEHVDDNGNVCGSLFKPFADYNNMCPDHWKVGVIKPPCLTTL